MLMALMGLLMALGVMVVDVGMAYGSRREAQTAADLAALAGAGLLPDDPTGAQTLVLDYLKSNGLDPADPDVTAQVPFPSANQIEVLVSAPSRTFFSGVFAINGLDRVSGRAVAEGQPDVPGGGGIGGGAAPPIPIPVLPAASPVDGRVTIGDGYTKLGDLYGGSTDYGDILVARDGFFISFAMVLNGPDTGGPVGNENVYYPRAKDNGGVDLHADYQTGWKKHDFKALEKSDRAHFQVGCDGAAIHDFEQDYLRPDGAGWTSDANGDGQIVTAGPTESASSLEWNPENPTLTGWGDDPGEDPLTQSPPFNGSLYPNYDAPYDGWVWEMIYEFKVPESAYSGCSTTPTFTLPEIIGGGGTVGGLHSSPGKTAAGAFLQARAARAASGWSSRRDRAAQR